MTATVSRSRRPLALRLTTRVPPTVAWVLGATILVIGWGLLDPGDARQRMDWFLQDRWIAQRTPPRPHPDIVLVLEDDLAAEQLGQTDGRHRRARALRQLGPLGARTVVFDYLLLDAGSEVSFYREEALYDGLPPDLFDEVPELADYYREDDLQQQALAALLRLDTDNTGTISTVLPCFFRRPSKAAAEVTRRLVEELVENPWHPDARSLARATSQDLPAVLGHLGQAISRAAHEIARDETRSAEVINRRAPLLAEQVRRARDKTKPATIESLVRSSFPDPKKRESPSHGLDRLELPRREFLNDTILAFVDVESTGDFVMRRLKCLNAFSLPAEPTGQQDSTRHRQMIHQALAAVLIHTGQSIQDVRRLESGIMYLSQAEDSRVPLDEDRQLIINWPLNGQTPWQDQFEPPGSQEQPSRIVRLSELLQLAKLERDLHETRIAIRRLAIELDERLELGLDCQTTVRAIRERLIAFADGEEGFPEARLAEFETSHARPVLDHKSTRQLLGRSADPLGQAARELERRLNRDLPDQRERWEALRAALATRVRGKLCLIGQVKTGSSDMHNTPVGRLPGIVVNAAAVNTLLTRDFLVSQSFGSTVLVTVAVMLAVAALFIRLGVVPATMSVIPLMLLVTWIHQGLLAWSNAVTQPVLPLAGIAVCFSAVTIRKWWGDNLARRKVRRAFEFYLHPAVVERVAEDPAELQLGGAATELSILFSDIRGFTSIAERLPDEDLTRLLNEYLTAMTEIVFDNNGTVDKYIGDAIMAFYGAPIADDLHPLRACRTAIRMSEQLDSLRQQWRDRGLPTVRIGVGINTAVVRVGNFGSDLRFDYTVIGDGVNLASRLEGANKQYGTELLISETTRERVHNELPTRELDLIQVKGRQRPTRIFELLGEGPLEPAAADRVARFESALSAYRDRDFEAAMAAFLELAEADPPDPPTRIYVDRCRQLLETPPPEHWDGVFVMTSK